MTKREKINLREAGYVTSTEYRDGVLYFYLIKLGEDEEKLLVYKKRIA